MSSLDYAIFAAPDFNTNEYANAILASDSSGGRGIKHSTQDSVSKDDISLAISKLTFGIEDVSKQIKNLVRLLSPLDLPMVLNPAPLLRLQPIMKNCLSRHPMLMPFPVRLSQFEPD